MGRQKISIGRSKSWHLIADSVGFTFEILKSNLLQSEAIYTEAALIKLPDHDWNLVNKRANETVVNELDYKDISQYLEYSASSFTGLVWKVDRPSGSGYKGNVAGYIDKRKFCRVGINGRYIPTHRIVYLLHHGSIDSKLVVDHVDGNSANNRIENLRLVTISQNNKNKVSSAHGLFDCPDKKQGNYVKGRYYVQWNCPERSKQHGKAFAYGVKRTKEQALLLATAFRDSLVEQGLILTRKI